MIPIELGELGPPVAFALTAEQGRSLARSGLVTAVPSPFDPGMWLVGPRGGAGAARVGEMEIHVAPKLAIARLLFLAGYAVSGAAWRAEDVALDEAAGLVPAFARALSRQVARAIGQGLLPGYVVVEKSSAVLRGRLLESAQLHRHHGLAFPLEIVHDEFTIDIAENRILRTACERMLAVPGVDSESSRMLRRLLREFGDVTPLHRAEPVPAWQPTRINARYHPALRLAELVLRATSSELLAGDVVTGGFWFDLPKLFEEFVTAALREALEAGPGGRVAGQDPHYLDHAGQVTLKPDLVWYLRGVPVAVADAKYKAEKPAGYPNADLYQMLAYCVALRLPRGHLIYACGSGEPARHVVREAGTEILAHALDLGVPPAELLAQISDLAGLIAGSVSTETAGPA